MRTTSNVILSGVLLLLHLHINLASHKKTSKETSSKSKTGKSVKKSSYAVANNVNKRSTINYPVANRVNNPTTKYVLQQKKGLPSQCYARGTVNRQKRLRMCNTCVSTSNLGPTW